MLHRRPKVTPIDRSQHGIYPVSEVVNGYDVHFITLTEILECESYHKVGSDSRMRFSFILKLCIAQETVNSFSLRKHVMGG